MKVMGFLLFLILVNIFAAKMGTATAYKNNKEIKELRNTALVFIAGGLIGVLFTL